MKKEKFIIRKVWFILLMVLGGALASSVFPVLLLRFVPPPVSSFMAQRYIAARWAGQADFTLKYQWVGIRQISPQAALAVVASEDQKFPTHYGFDFASIDKALKDNPHRARPRGASTISQQVAKNLFLWPGRSFFRKGLEAYFTLLLETLWPKRRILEMYLNIAELGPGIFGVKAAGALYFKKTPEELTKMEAALLAAVLPNPLRLHAGSPSKYLRERQQEIMQQMEQLGGPGYLKGIW